MILSGDPAWPNPANVFIIPDKDGFSMIDVGCGGFNGADHLLKGLAHWGLDLKYLHTVFFSHAHPDHIGAMDWIMEEVRPRAFIHRLEILPALDPKTLNETFDVPLAKRRTASCGKQELSRELDMLTYFKRSKCSVSASVKAEPLDENQVIHLGDFSFEVIHTPGHSPGHIAFFERDRGILLSGDMIGESPTYYSPASGGVLGYYKTLDRLESLPAKIILPSHGTLIKEPLKIIHQVRATLLDKETVFLKLLQSRPRNFWDLTGVVYDKPRTRAFPGCGVVESHLIKFELEGSIMRDGDMIYIK